MSFIQNTRKPISNLLGYKVGRLEVVEYLGKGKHNKHYWRCFCECGGWTDLATYRITGSTPTLTCGCERIKKLKENRCDPTRHGLYKHKLYAIFHGMKYRCYNQKAPRWKYYGGKGVKICDSWSEFIHFYSWSIDNGYREGLSIDRIDSDGNYEPSNCRWVTLSENTTRSNKVDRDG